VRGDELPKLQTEVPGPLSRELAARLAQVECPEVTWQCGPLDFWERASGSNVYDVDGNRYVDLLAGFGVAALGYSHPELAVRAARQSETLPHAMGDVYPARIKVELLETLQRVLPGSLGLAILSSSGSDAVESALKTALVATGKPGVIAFEGAYHGLGFGALDTTWREHFRGPFAERLAGRTTFVPYGDARTAERAITSDTGAILVEPIQGRGGLRIPPKGFLRELREIADRTGVLLICDEVYTGLGRTGAWLASDLEGVEPDLVAIGKALGCGFPISACVGRPEVMRAWGAAQGEAIHTSTHLGNPLGCALALLVLQILERDALPERARALGERALLYLQAELAGAPGVVEVRGRGLMLGIELDSREKANAAIRGALESGWILLGEGDDGRVLSITPPLTIAEDVLDGGLVRLVELLSR